MIIKVFKIKTCISVALLLGTVLLAFITISKVNNAQRVGSAAHEDKNILSEEKKDKNFIKWVDFNVPYEAMNKTLTIDIESHEKEIKHNWIDLLAYLAAKYGGNFNRYKDSDVNKLVAELESGVKLEDLTTKMQHFSYFQEAYTAVLGGFVGEFEIEQPDKNNPDQIIRVKKYGLKVFSPIAKGFSFSHFDDFGNSRNYGFKRKHLGHDLMGGIGTPIIAVESGVVEQVGWNQYGGWRVGIRSFDTKRYYYYAHLRKDHPYNDLFEGKVVKGGDVIGYLGMTGYSTKENVNNIKTPHLHYGMQLIFDESQVEGNNEIWIDLYDITKLLQRNRSTVYKDNEKKEYYRKYDMFEEYVRQ